MADTFYADDQLYQLRRLTVPTLANAVEAFGVQSGSEGACNARLQCRYPKRPMLIGYAVTSRVATQHYWNRQKIDEHRYWKFVQNSCGVSKIAVCQDMDSPAYGAMWGEFNTNAHRALGCRGLIVDGAVRDLDGIAKLDFQVFSTEVHPTHGNGAFIDYGGPVAIAGLTIETGDLLVGDEHGVIKIPAAIDLQELIAVAHEIDSLEQRIFQVCQAENFSLEQLERVDREVAAAWPNPRQKEQVTGPR